MSRFRLVALTGLLAAVAPALGQSFDHLNEADRQVLQQRFEREIWPLLVRNGKDGCVGCHNGKGGGSLRLRGHTGRDFSFLVKEGFFLPNDAGSLLSRILDKDKKRRMPPNPRPSWTAAEIKLLRDFEADLDKKQKK